MNKLSLLAVVLGITLLVAANLADGHVLFTRTQTPSGWRRLSVAKHDATISFVLGLKQRNLDVLDRVFRDVSTPGSPSYRQYLSNQQVWDIIQPHPESIQAVTSWLKSHGIPSKHIQVTGDAVEVSHTPVSIVSRLFNTKFYEFVQSSAKNAKATPHRVIKAWGTYEIPANLASIIEVVEGVSNFPVPHFRVHASKPSNRHSHHRHNSTHHSVHPKQFGPQTAFVPESLKALYKVRTEKFGSAAKTTSQGVIEFPTAGFSADDLTQYAQQVALKIATLTPKHIVGDVGSPDTESSLDLDMITTIDDESTNWYWLGTEWLYTWSVAFFKAKTVPQVISISYGWSESDQCDTQVSTECQTLGVDNNAYVNRVNTELKKIGLRGVSIIVSSGDSGASSRYNQACEIPYLFAEFPASSPYVTAVGATQIGTDAVFNLQNPPPVCTTGSYNCVSGGTEEAVSYDQANFASGGGFSNISTRPDWQDDVVQNYLTQQASQLPPASYFNNAGRATPDVSAIGSNDFVISAGQLQLVGGTSASAPTFAAIVSLLNQISIKNSGKPLGFLNPLLYKAAAADATTFTDVTVGDNKCTESGCSESCNGYVAAAGWDPVTGLGTPNYDSLAKYVQNL